ncbi:MAG: hypothetical protein ABFS45_12485 [Pseudomonadota bacterium]
MRTTPENASRREINGILSVYYDGYWIKYYEPPVDSLSAKKSLIQSLTRRLFNHMEHGINIPGKLLDEVRSAYLAETNPKKKRVKAAMLAGALFNRAADIFTNLVELEACGIKIRPGNDLMHECGQCLQEALKYGKQVKHRNGDEGIDELWGEPFKAFTMSMQAFYESRYIKIAMTMHDIDKIAKEIVTCFAKDPRFAGIDELILEYAKMAKRKCETLRTDNDIFDIWSNFVVAGEDVIDFSPKTINTAVQQPNDVIDGKHLLKWGVRLIGFVTRARTPMPKSTEIYVAECERYKNRSD